MKLRMTMEIVVDDDALAEVYDEHTRAEIAARDEIAVGQLALDCFHARCSGGSWRLANGRRVVVKTGVIS